MHCATLTARPLVYMRTARALHAQTQLVFGIQKRHETSDETGVLATKTPPLQNPIGNGAEARAHDGTPC